MKKWVLFLILVSCSTITYPAGNNGFSFLKITPTPRAAAMGESYVAVAQGAETVFYNPAGLGFEDSIHLYTHSHIPPFLEGMKYNSLVYSRPTQNGGWSLQSGMFYITDFKRRIADSSNPDGFRELDDFMTYDLKISFSIATRLAEELSVGSTVGYIRESLSDISASDFTSDFGILYRNLSSPIQLGISVQHLGPAVRFKEESWSPPLLIRSGLSFQMRGESSWKGSLITAEFLSPLQGDGSLRSGIEFPMTESFWIRAGYRAALKNQNLGSQYSLPNGFTLGLGIRNTDWELDYAAVSMGELGLEHQISLDLKWNRPEEKLGERIHFVKKKR